MAHGKAFDLLGYTKAQYYQGVDSYVGYYVKHPVTKEKKRVKIKLNHISSKVERKKYAAQLCAQINAKLDSGWNPFAENDNSKLFHSLDRVVKTYLSHKESELRSDSKRTIKSHMRYFLEYLRKIRRLDDYAMNWTRQDASDFMDHIIFNKNLKGVSFNNYLKDYKALGNWMVSKGHTQENPWNNIKKKLETQKDKSIIPREWRTRIKNDLEVHEPGLLFVSQLIFYCFLRPKEISMLKFSDINLQTQKIRVRGEISKNRKDAHVTISNEFLPVIAKYIQDHDPPSNYFLVSYGMVPGAKGVGARYYAKRWAWMRERLNLPMDMKLYSMKDSGIVQALDNEISPHEVMKQARHSSLEETTAYLRFKEKDGLTQVANKMGGF